MNTTYRGVGGFVIATLLVFSPTTKSAGRSTTGSPAKSPPSEASQAAPGNQAPGKPPESAYDRMLRNTNKSAPKERSLTTQLIQTLLALGLVIGLIYLLFKVGLGRFLPGSQMASFGKRGDQEIRVADRIAIDAKNSVVILEIANQRRILVGSGERGVDFLCELEDVTPASEAEEPV